MSDAPVSVELRVLTGPQAGAAVALAPGATIDVGSLSASGCQVVLRDPRVSDQRLRLHVRANDVRIDVLVGDVDLAGQVLTGPCTVDWPHFLPVRLGDTVLAVGDAGNPRWSQVLAIAEAAPRAGWSVEAPAATQPLPANSPTTATATTARRRPLEHWLALGGAGIAAVALLLIAFVHLVTPRAPVVTAAQRLERMLQAPDYRGLAVRQDADGHLVLTGDLVRLRDRARLDRDLAEAGVTATVDVRVGERIALAVRDVYQMNGVPAEALVPRTLDEVGRVAVQTVTSDPEQLARIEAAVRRDVPGLQALSVENTVPDAEPVPTAVRDDPGKRIASIVPGDVAYVVTADGTRYFAGALLPSGHRIASITGSEVRLEKDGKPSSLRF